MFQHFLHPKCSHRMKLSRVYAGKHEYSRDTFVCVRPGAGHVDAAFMRGQMGGDTERQGCQKMQ